MTDQRSQAEIVRQSLKRRYRKERRFRAYGILAIAIALSALVVLFVDIIGKGYTGFTKTTITMEVELDGEMMYLDDATDKKQIKMADFVEPLLQALIRQVPGATEENRDAVRDLLNPYASNELRDMLEQNPEWLGTTQTLTVLAHTDVDVYVKHAGDDAYSIKLSDRQQRWVDQLVEKEVVQTSFNDVFFSSGDSRDPSRAGILGAIVGSLLTMLVTLVLSFPIGVAAAIYLEEFAPQNRLTDLIEVNINNLAAVPSILFGLLGLAVFINLLPSNFVHGYTEMQVVLHHVLPLAMPGMLTGSIIGMAQALGETAPLLLIGMVAFIVDVPDGFFDSATVLPVQVFLWAGSPELAFIERASAAIMVLLAFLVSMNALAIWLRKRLERRW